ncbi:MAG: hypothetical protein KF715_10740 [Candidatus Didemnitutus sp.]|nr:hypothetical protein [Candidatus Didemnitutus sp.]
MIGELYLREREWDAANVGTARPRAPASTFALRLPARWLRWTAIGLRRHLPRSLTGKACTYLLDNWELLTAHLRHSESRFPPITFNETPSALGHRKEELAFSSAIPGTPVAPAIY